MRRPYLNVNTLNERPGLPQGTNIHFFPHKIGWEGTPAFFLNATSTTCATDIANVVRFDMFVELVAKLFHCLA